MRETEAQKRERHHQEDLQRLRGFRPIDDTFMRGMFKDTIPLAELVLRIIVGKPDLTLTKCETQADLKCVTGTRSICLDAYATDSTGKKYDIEIQRSDNGADPHRARYHSERDGCGKFGQGSGLPRTAGFLCHFHYGKRLRIRPENLYMSFRT